MRSNKDKGRLGFTLVELMVVLGIVALLTAVAIPGLARLGAFSRDEYRRTVNEVAGLLRAAQIYSTTYHVNTAVVYGMDNWSSNEAATGTDMAVAQPVIDSVTGNPVRQIISAAVMYELPSTSLALSGHYVPVPNSDGEFRELPHGMSIFLQNPEDAVPDNSGVPGGFYNELTWSNFGYGATVDNLDALGMSTIRAALGIPTGLDSAGFQTLAASTTNFMAEDFMAHVFKPSGRMVAPGGLNVERFTMYIGPAADRSPEDRMVDPELGTLLNTADDSPNMMYREIHIFKSTGRAEVPKNF